MAFKVFLICGTDPSEQVAAWRLQTLATSYGMHVSVPNRNGPVKGVIDHVRRAIDHSDCILAIVTSDIPAKGAVETELKYALSREAPVLAVVQEGIKIPRSLAGVPVFHFSPSTSGQTETEILEFLRKQNLSSDNLRSMAAFLLAGLGVFLLAAMSEE
jgi:hypothetical protein